MKEKDGKKTIDRMMQRHHAETMRSPCSHTHLRRSASHTHSTIFLKVLMRNSTKLPFTHNKLMTSLQHLRLDRVRDLRESIAQSEYNAQCKERTNSSTMQNKNEDTQNRTNKEKKKKNDAIHVKTRGHKTMQLRVCNNEHCANVVIQ